MSAITRKNLKQEVFFNRGSYKYILSNSLKFVDMISAEFKDTYALELEQNGQPIFSRHCQEVTKPIPPHFGARFQ